MEITNSRIWSEDEGSVLLVIELDGKIELDINVIKPKSQLAPKAVVDWRDKETGNFIAFGNTE